MTKKYDPMFAFRYHRKSIRQPNHNYTWSGIYFVTIDTEQREPLFEIPELRAILLETWNALPERFTDITLDEFIVMPDHIHFIVCLEGNVEKPTSLPNVVGAYKSLTAVAWLHHIRAAGMERSARVWQRNYFDRAIRDASDLERTRQYIRTNPTRRKQRNDNTVLPNAMPGTRTRVYGRGISLRVPWLAALGSQCLGDPGRDKTECSGTGRVPMLRNVRDFRVPTKPYVPADAGSIQRVPRNRFHPIPSPGHPQGDAPPIYRGDARL